MTTLRDEILGSIIRHLRSGKSDRQFKLIVYHTVNVSLPELLEHYRGAMEELATDVSETLKVSVTVAMLHIFLLTVRSLFTG